MENQYPNILFRNDKNIFYARIPYIDKITGNKKRKTVYGSSKNEVKSKIDDFLLSQENDFASTNKNKTIAQVIREEAENDYALNNIQESSYLRRIETLKMIEKHCIAKVKIKDIDKNIINSFFRYLVDYGYSNSTIKKICCVLRRNVTAAYNEGLIENNPFVVYNIKNPKSRKNDKVVIPLTIEEQKRFTEAAENYIPSLGNTSNKNLQPLIELYSGMRMGEINALRLSDVDFKNKKINICGTIENGKNYSAFRVEHTKTKSGMRKIPINVKLEKYLKRAVENYTPNEEQLIFFDKENNKPIATQSVNKVIRSICKRANVRMFSSHTLRHTYATRLVESNVPIKIVQNLLGHNDITITLNTYTSVLDDYESAAMDIINNEFSKM
mgnify:FL=1